MKIIEGGLPEDRAWRSLILFDAEEKLGISWQLGKSLALANNGEIVAAVIISSANDPDLYLGESAVTHAPDAKAPFLIMHGTSDPTVAFQNALGLYNALRFNSKTAVLLAYPGEGHGLRGLANRKDLTVRYFEFFNHYLKGEPAPEWLTKGVPYLEKNRR